MKMLEIFIVVFKFQAVIFIYLFFFLFNKSMFRGGKMPREKNCFLLVLNESERQNFGFRGVWSLWKWLFVCTL